MTNYATSTWITPRSLFRLARAILGAFPTPLRPLRRAGLIPRPAKSGFSGTRPLRVPLIYAVDDELDLTELYVLMLEPAGYAVKTFNLRADAVAALRTEAPKPDLLITDYRGSSMPTERFLCSCRRAAPSLRILMVSGFSPFDLHFGDIRPDRFLCKPFGAEELETAIKILLTTR